MEREPPSLLHPPLPCFIFAPIFISRRSQLSERLEHSKNCPSALLSSCHFQWSTQVTYWNWLPVSVTGVLLSAYSTVARSIALPLVRSCCLCLVLSFFFSLLVNLLLELGLATFCLPAFHFNNQSFFKSWLLEVPKARFLACKAFEPFHLATARITNHKRNYFTVSSFLGNLQRLIAHDRWP